MMMMVLMEVLTQWMASKVDNKPCCVVALTHHRPKSQNHRRKSVIVVRERAAGAQCLNFDASEIQPARVRFKKWIAARTERPIE
jgi:hypothetical protein